MKKLILILLVLVGFSSCLSEEYIKSENTATKIRGVVLDKRESCYKVCQYDLYVYDGEAASWLSTDYATYTSVSKDDTLQVLLVKKTYFKTINECQNVKK